MGLNNVVLSPLFVVVNILNNIVEQFVTMVAVQHCSKFVQYCLQLSTMLAAQLFNPIFINAEIFPCIFVYYRLFSED